MWCWVLLEESLRGGTRRALVGCIIPKSYKQSSVHDKQSMSNLLVLDDQSFYLDSNRRSPSTMKLRMGGPVVVLFFTMPRCRGCHAFKPLYSQLASSNARLTFATADLAVLKSVVNMSRASSTPLQSVPTLILYSDGLPRAKFKGNMNLNSVESFLAKGLTAITTSAPVRYAPRRPSQKSAPTSVHVRRRETWVTLLSGRCSVYSFRQSRRRR